MEDDPRIFRSCQVRHQDTLHVAQKDGTCERPLLKGHLVGVVDVLWESFTPCAL